MGHKLRELRSELERFHSEIAAVGAKSHADQVMNFINTLKLHDEENIDDFVSEARDLLTQKSKHKPSTPAKTLNELAIKRYVKALEDCGHDQTAFDEAYKELTNDKKNIRKTELYEIVSRYYGDVKRSLTVGQLKDKLKHRFRELGQNRSKDRLLDKITPW